MGGLATLVRQERPLVARELRRMTSSKSAHDVLRISLAVLIILSVSHIQQRYGFIEALRPGLLFTGLALVSAFVNPKGLADFAWLREWPAKIVIALIVASLASIVFGISQGGAWYFFSNFFWKVAVTALLLMAAMRTIRDVALFAWAYVIGSAILVYMALFVFEMKAEANGITRLSHLDTWDANDVCVVLLIALPFCLLFLRTSKTFGRCFAGIVLIGIGAAVARSGSRGGFIGLNSLLIAYIVSMKGAARSRGFLMVLAVGTGLVVAAPIGYWKQMNTLTAAKSDYNYYELQGRRQLAIRGMGYMLNYPVFGIGIGNFGRAEGTISPIAGMKGTIWSAPHNSYVEAGAELGVPGFIFFILLVLGCIIMPWRLRRSIPDQWATGTEEQQLIASVALYLPLCAVGFAIPAFFVSFAYLDPIYMIAAMNGALIVCTDRELREASMHRSRRLKSLELTRDTAIGRSAVQTPEAASFRRTIRWAPAPSLDRSGGAKPPSES